MTGDKCKPAASKRETGELLTGNRLSQSHLSFQLNSLLRSYNWTAPSSESLGMRYADFDGEETLEKTTKDKDIENSTTQVDLNLTECLGMRYEVSDNEETYVVH